MTLYSKNILKYILYLLNILVSVDLVTASLTIHKAYSDYKELELVINRRALRYTGSKR